MVVRNFLTNPVHENFKKELRNEWDRKYYDTRRKRF